MMIPRPKGQKGLYNSQGEVEEPGPTDMEYIGSGQTIHEGDKRDPGVKPLPPLDSTYAGFL